MNGTTQRPWDEGLIGPARRIAEVDHSPLRVVAGPGTGKTFALMRRIARLLQNGATADRILVCTFTRTAARDLQRELSRLGVSGAENVHAGTLHSLCFSLLWQANVLELTHRVPRPLLEVEERFLVQDLNGANFGGIREREERLRAFNAAWARLQTDEPGWPTDLIDREFERALLSWLCFHEAMLIGEIVPVTLRYLRDNPASSDLRAFDHVLVDEFQDLNRAEQELLNLLAMTGTLAIIGDEDQSIYSFKHAHPEGIVNFHQNNSGTHDESLLDCRRCPQLVVELANTLIANNTSRTPKTLRPFPENPSGEVLIVQWTSMEEEAQGIAQFIQQRIQTGAAEAGRVLVLAPQRQLGYAIRDALNNLGVLAHSFFHEQALDGDPKDLEESDAQQAFALLTLLANPDDRVALRCWCGFGSSSLRSGAWARLCAYCEQTGDSPRVVLERLASGELALPYSSELVTRFRELQSRLAELRGLRGGALIDALFPANENWAAPFRSLATSIEENEFDAESLRETLRIGVTQPELPTDVDYVRVMSLHKSKGLTADLVVVVGCIQGLIPFLRQGLSPVEHDRALEEQRRLFFGVFSQSSG